MRGSVLLRRPAGSGRRRLPRLGRLGSLGGRRRLLAALVLGALLVVVGAVAALAGGGEAPVRREVLSVPGTPEPGGAPVTLDATLFLPARTPAPAVLLAHGFGGSKDSETADATALARAGYVALAYTARGFGRSGGLIHLDAPAYEVADGSRLLDLLARRPEVRQDGANDPRVGVAGGSYGGALGLLLAGTDRRVDAIAPAITWNDLRQALFPQQAVAEGPPRSPADVAPIAPAGVFKRGWAGALFGSEADGTTSGGAPGCGRFAPDVCAAYAGSAQAGTPTPEILDLLAASSPRTVLARITAPTLLMQGQTDSLFPLSEGDANARGIAATGTPVKTVWFDGGHDGGDQESARLRRLTLDWFGRYLQRDGSRPDTRFEVTVPRSRVSSTDSSAAARVRAAAGLPGAGVPGPVRTVSLPLTGGVQTALAPAGGNPAALTSLPGAGGALGSALGALGSTALADLPGQSASFQTAPLDRPLSVVGSPSVDLTVVSTARDATLFAKLYDVAPGGRTSLPRQLVAPLRLDPVPAGSPVRVALPAVVLDLPAGHRLRLTVSSTDSSYALPLDARGYRIGLAGDGALRLPQVATAAVGGSSTAGLWRAAGALALAVALGAAAVALLARRARRGGFDPGLAGVPLAITDLGKAYSGGYRAVSDLSFRVEAGQVLGLLGPNGAGKTTTLRMLVGLITPTEGGIAVFGHRVRPGSPVLSRIGAFIEGPGFLPHLSGRDNLELYWRATGRPPADAALDTALEVAGLGSDIERRVKTYSQGMRQRLAIAQAMLGLPELLVLDEPTNGLDPPQIREMREVLARYAASGRTVVVSSHLLAEVEQTCSDVVVMHRGRLVAQGPVAEIIGSTTAVVVDVDDPAAAAAVVAELPGATDLQVTPTGVTLRLIQGSRADLVRALVAAGVGVDRVAPQRGLEEAFLALVGEA